MPSRLTIEKYIAKTRKQLSKQKLKHQYSQNEKDKEKAREEIKRLRKKMEYFQNLSNEGK